MSQDQNPIHEKYTSIAVIDQETRQMFLSYAKDSPELVQDIIDSFAPEAGEIIKLIEESVRNSDFEQLRYNAHSLAGICGSIGAMQLRQIASDTEAAIRDEDWSRTLETAKLVPENYELLLKALKEF